MKSALFFLLLLAGLPLAGRAQSASRMDSLRRHGELTGARPSGGLLARPRATAPRSTPAGRPRGAAADPVQQHLLGTTVNLAEARAEQLPDLYEQFISTTRAERRQWSYEQWDAAGAVLARLNERYAQVRTELPLEERLRIRTFQGEYHALRGARKVKSAIDE
ncbi:hypothetical protein IC235_19425 [Hymenobacter sp. BT664]|uniref:Uncharacterized protein n=1 Tax=Hymenobacter montanus TaxID=2771359 RepID=A0A927GLD1_9BACT|nr:hypothetical protein [Hymenobacter montanus]MBD2770064.1 hypothetical protein [Hymenobacter montanus]